MAQAEVVAVAEDAALAGGGDRRTLGRIPVESAAPDLPALAVGDGVVVRLVATDRAQAELRIEVDEEGTARDLLLDIARGTLVVAGLRARIVEPPAEQTQRSRIGKADAKGPALLVTQAAAARAAATAAFAAAAAVEPTLTVAHLPLPCRTEGEDKARRHREHAHLVVLVVVERIARQAAAEGGLVVARNRTVDVDEDGVLDRLEAATTVQREVGGVLFRALDVVQAAQAKVEPAPEPSRLAHHGDARRHLEDPVLLGIGIRHIDVVGPRELGVQRGLDAEGLCLRRPAHGQREEQREGVQQPWLRRFRPHSRSGSRHSRIRIHSRSTSPARCAATC